VQSITREYTTPVYKESFNLGCFFLSSGAITLNKAEKHFKYGEN
jgi:hypothetical protein